jgi:hypothetical protein
MDLNTVFFLHSAFFDVTENRSAGWWLVAEADLL